MTNTNLPVPAFTPVPRKKDRSNGWKPEVQHAFIEALAETGSVEAACRRVGRSSVGAYHLRRQPGAEEFAKAWAKALDHGVRRIEDVAMDRALNGVEVPVYSYGKLVGTRRIYNDRLLMFMLRNRAPERFAADGARGMNALDRQRLARMKKEWRAEWEQESALRDSAEEAEELESLDAMLDQMCQRELAAMSPRTRALYEAWQAAQREDRAKGSRWLAGDDPGDGVEAEGEDVQRTPAQSPARPNGRPDPGLDPGGGKPSGPGSEAEQPKAGHRPRPASEGETIQAPPPGFFPEPEEPEPWDGLRRLKDERWD